jgi:hypothetical protein
MGNVGGAESTGLFGGGWPLDMGIKVQLLRPTSIYVSLQIDTYLDAGKSQKSMVYSQSFKKHLT